MDRELPEKSHSKKVPKTEYQTFSYFLVEHKCSVTNRHCVTIQSIFKKSDQ